MKKVLMVLSLFVLFSCENESEQSDFDYDRHNDKVLSVAKQVWKEAKPVVSADAQGAATALATGTNRCRSCSCYWSLCKFGRKVY